MSKYRLAINSNVASAASGDTVELLPDGNVYPTGAIELTDADGDDIWISADIDDIDQVGDFDVYVNGSELVSQTEADNIFFANEGILDLKDAVNIDYDNAASGLAAANVKAALDELDTDVTAKPDDATDIGLGDVLNIKHKIDATSDPGVGDDSGDDYSAGSIWVNVTDDKSFICEDASVGAAVWREIADADPSNITLADAGEYFTASQRNVEAAIQKIGQQLGLENSNPVNSLEGTSFLDKGITTIIAALRKLDAIIGQQVLSQLDTIGAWEVYTDFDTDTSATPSTSLPTYAITGDDTYRTYVKFAFNKTASMTSLQVDFQVDNTGADTIIVSARITVDGQDNEDSISVTVAGGYSDGQVILNLDSVSAGVHEATIELKSSNDTANVRYIHAVALPT